MKEYHKIQTLYLHDPATNHKTLLVGQFARPEFEFVARSPWVFTEKVDGTNIRVGWDGAAVAFGGRTDDAQVPSPLFAHLLSTFTAALMVAVFGDALVTLYGEGYGPKIQKGGGRYRDTPGFILFDVVVGDVWLERHNVEDVASQLAIPTVPIIGEGTVYDAVDLVRGGFPTKCAVDPTMPPEGIVFRPKVELFDRRGQRVISKLKAKDFAATTTSTRPAEVAATVTPGDGGREE